MKAHVSLLGLTLLLSACGIFKQTALYDAPADDANTPNIAGFYALNIYSDQMSDEIWYTQSPKAIQVKSEATQKKQGDNSISIEWNKQADPQTWLGLGFGWNGWTGKNFASITQQSALSFWVKMKNGQSAGLPWAVGFEDFNGSQAWTGVTTGFIEGGIIKEEWTQVRIPLSAFPFEERDVDLSIIKQLIVQFESSGKVWIDDIKIIPYTAKGRQSFDVAPVDAIMIDGAFQPNEWPQSSFQLPLANVKLTWNEEFLYIAAEVEDATPLINTRTGKDIWNGDALEIAFSSISGTMAQRKIFYPTDFHLGISMKPYGKVYDWSKDREVSGSIVRVQYAGKGYSAEVAIPWKSLGISAFEPGKTYDCEIAVDIADGSSVRTLQSRWNSADKEGFNFDPSRWGSINYRVQKND